VTLPALATLDDVSAIVGRTLSSTEQTNGTRLLNMASGMVRRYTRQTITKVTDDVVTLEGNWGHVLTLPQHPVTAVSSVVFNGGTMPNTQWKLYQGDLFLGTGSYMPDYGGSIWGGTALWGPAGSNNGPQVAGATWQGPQSTVTVTYTHGYDEVPQDIVNEVAGMVALQLSTEVGISSEQIGGYKVQYDRAQTGGMTLNDESKSVLNFYRKRAISSSIAVPR
jgi:hypothetical protein